MSKSVTAKVKCGSNIQFHADMHTVTFYADYYGNAAEVNKEWAAATPSLSISMTVKDASLFEAGKAYTLSFIPED